MDYMSEALFIYDEHSEYLIEPVSNNRFGTQIRAVEKQQFLSDPQDYLLFSSHLVVSGSMEFIDQMLAFAYEQSFQSTDKPCSLAFLPLPEQRILRHAYQLPSSDEENIEIALRDDIKPVNLQQCNGQLFQFKAVIGEIPLLEAWHSDASAGAFFKNIVLGLKQFFRLSKNKISIETRNGKAITTVANGIFIVNQNRGSRLTRAIQQKSSMRSDMLSMMIVSPFSVVEYFLFLISLIFHLNRDNSLPRAVANIQSNEIKLECESFNQAPPTAKLDDLKTVKCPLHFKIIKNALSINASDRFWELNPVINADKETIRIDNLPDEKELNKYIDKKLPFFSVASEERFKDLFLQLREDARINSLYISLILLSTLLASLGLYANSSAVVIGAMLLAPLMSPIISSSMGLLRGEDLLFYQSLKKLGLGIALALLASFILTLFMPQVDLSGEIRARINPNLIDLAIAIFSGIAAAYTKAHKELLNNLAGVAIAVALVPPLASAGIGLGRGESYVFEGAILLFVTNLVGIMVAATMTFQFLGFSNTVKRKKSLTLIILVLVVLSYPLYRTYSASLQRYYLTRALANEQLMINNNKVLIEKAVIDYQNKQRIINITLVVKQALNEHEMKLLRQVIKQRFTSKGQIRISIKYIL